MAGPVTTSASTSPTGLPALSDSSVNCTQPGATMWNALNSATALPVASALAVLLTDWSATASFKVVDAFGGRRSSTEQSTIPALLNSPNQSTLVAGSRKRVMPERSETDAPRGLGSR